MGLPIEFWSTKEFNKREQGSLAWKMHNSQHISSVMWKDKKVVLLVSSHAIPLGPPNVAITVVPQRSGAIREFIPSFPMHLIMQHT